RRWVSRATSAHKVGKFRGSAGKAGGSVADLNYGRSGPPTCHFSGVSLFLALVVSRFWWKREMAHCSGWCSYRPTRRLAGRLPEERAMGKGTKEPARAHELKPQGAGHGESRLRDSLRHLLRKTRLAFASHCR